MVKTVCYLRTSKNSQQNGIEVQREALSRYKVDKWYEEKISGKREDRQELNKAINILNKGDILLVYKIDRLGRSTKQLINILSELESKGVNVIFHKENIDTSTAMGKVIFTIMAAIAELEATYISERTKEALAIVKSKGVKLGNKSLDPFIESYICEKIIERKMTYKQISLQCGVCEKTIYNVKNRNNL